MNLSILKKRNEFKFIAKHGRTIFSYSFFVQFIKTERLFTNNDKQNIFYGITVSKKVGNAVVRNKLKRMFKVLIRSSQSILNKNFCYVIIGKHKAYEKNITNLQQELKYCLNKIQKYHYSNKTPKIKIPTSSDIE